MGSANNGRQDRGGEGRMMKSPDTCTSLTCGSFDSGYCRECSHAIYYGNGIDETGKAWKWEFNPWFGPTFLTKNGEPLVNQPGEKSKVWEIFESWLSEL
jgi:hypothetical protein